MSIALYDKIHTDTKYSTDGQKYNFNCGPSKCLDMYTRFGGLQLPIPIDTSMQLLVPIQIQDLEEYNYRSPQVH